MAPIPTCSGTSSPNETDAHATSTGKRETPATICRQTRCICEGSHSQGVDRLGAAKQPRSSQTQGDILQGFPWLVRDSAQMLMGTEEGNINYKRAGNGQDAAHPDHYLVMLNVPSMRGRGKGAHAVGTSQGCWGSLSSGHTARPGAALRTPSTVKALALQSQVGEGLNPRSVPHPQCSAG